MLTASDSQKLVAPFQGRAGALLEVGQPVLRPLLAELPRQLGRFRPHEMAVAEALQLLGRGGGLRCQGTLAREKVVLGALGRERRWRHLCQEEPQADRQHQAPHGRG